MKHKVTCKHCKSRYLGCHDECADYQAFRKERNELLELKNKKHDIIDAINNHNEKKFHKVFISRSKRGRIL